MISNIDNENDDDDDDDDDDDNDDNNDEFLYIFLMNEWRVIDSDIDRIELETITLKQ